MSETQQFGKWRSRLWPIHKFELKKIIPMVAMVFLILFIYTVLRDLKDTLVNTSCSAAAIPFVKVWGTVPAAIVFMVLYSKMSNTLSRTKLFYFSVMPFIAFFALFAIYIYPNAQALEPTSMAASMEAVLPKNLIVLADMLRHWPYVVFYVMAELWGSVMLSLLFWGFANQTTGLGDAKRVYPIFGLFGNLSLLLSGEMIKRVSQSSAEGDAAFAHSINWFMGIVVVGAFAVMALYWFLNKHVLTDPRFRPAEVRKKKSKTKMGMLSSFKYLASSKYLLYLAAIVMAYGVAINLIEVTWKQQVTLQFPEKRDYMNFMGWFSQMTGLLTILTMLFLSGNVIRKFGWKTAALFTPAMMVLTSTVFFAFILFKNTGATASLLALFGATPVLMAVVLGFGQNILSKSSKYAFFDPTKEMAYIPLDEEQKVKGKAAIDVVGARLGKSGGSLIQQILIGVVGFGAMVPYVAIIVGGVLFMWVVSASALSKLFQQLTDRRETEAKEAVTATEQEVAPAAG